MNRREHLAAMLAMAAALLPATKLRALGAKMEEADSQYGLIGQMMTQPGQRAALVAILSEGTSTMPGNIAYLIGEDSANPDAIWIVELWDSKEAHAEIGRAHVLTPVTNAHLVYRLLLEKKKHTTDNYNKQTE